MKLNLTNAMIIVKNKYFSGFTLIELVVVVLLLGILSVFAMGRMFDQNQFAARGFFDDTVTAVRFAQKLAVSTGCDVQFSLSTTTGYALNQRAACPGTGAFSTVVMNPANRANAYQNSDIDGLTIPNVTIVFDARGQTTADFAITLSGGGDSYTFYVYQTTGLVDV